MKKACKSFLTASVLLSQIILVRAGACADIDSLWQKYDEAATRALEKGDYGLAEHQYIHALTQCMNLPTTDYRGYVSLISLAAERLARNDNDAATNVELRSMQTDAAEPILRPAEKQLRKQLRESEGNESAGYQSNENLTARTSPTLFRDMFEGAFNENDSKDSVVFLDPNCVSTTEINKSPSPGNSKQPSPKPNPSTETAPHTGLRADDGTCKFKNLIRNLCVVANEASAHHNQPAVSALLKRAQDILTLAEKVIQNRMDVLNMRFSLASSLLALDDTGGGKLLDTEAFDELRTELKDKSLRSASAAIVGIGIAASSYAEHGQLSRASELFDSAQSLVDNADEHDVDRDRFINWILYFKGLAFYHQKNYEKALECTNKAVNLSPADRSLYSLRAWSLALSKNYTKASESFKQFSEMFEDEPDGYVGLSWIDLRLKKFNDCIAEADKALKLDAHSAPAYCNRGKANFYLGKYPQALADLNKAIELIDKGEYHYYRGLVLEKLNQKTKAKLDLDRASQLKYVPESE